MLCEVPRCSPLFLPGSVILLEWDLLLLLSLFLLLSHGHSLPPPLTRLKSSFAQAQSKRQPEMTRKAWTQPSTAVFFWFRNIPFIFRFVILCAYCGRSSPFPPYFVVFHYPAIFVSLLFLLVLSSFFFVSCMVDYFSLCLRLS